MTKARIFSNITSWLRKRGPAFLALSWCLGLVCGIQAARTASDTLIPLMREAVRRPVSILGLLNVTVLPFLISAYAVSLPEPWLLLIISSTKAFIFGFCAYGVRLAFGQSSWLVRFLFLFSDSCLIPLLLLFWLRHIGNKKPVRRWELIACLAAAAIVGTIDYRFISPFLVTLLSS